MDCSKIQSGGGSFPVQRGVPDPSKGSDQNARSLSMLPVSNPSSNRRSAWRISASITEIAKQYGAIEKQSRRSRSGGAGGSGDHMAMDEAAREKLDRWMGSSVTEILKNLDQAPLLVHVYADDGEEWVVTKTEKAENWPVVKGKWERGEAEMPEGMIFVEELEDGNSSKSCSKNGGCGGDETERSWGLVVQGKCVECGPVCYLLKTTRVGAGPGTGIWSTQFSLVRLMNLREHPESQHRKCWLLGREGGVKVRCGIHFDVV